MRKIFIVIVSVIIVAFIILKSGKREERQFIQIGNSKISVEVARTAEERSLGLSYQRKLPENSGMLFVFPQKSFQTFWMKGMNFDLDFIWIADGKVVDITENVPAPRENVPDEALPTYRSINPIDAMLEVNSGFVVKNKIKVGDPVIIKMEER